MRNTPPILIRELSEDAIDHLVGLGFDLNEPAGPIVVRVFENWLQEIGDRKALYELLGVKKSTLSNWVRAHARDTRPIHTSIEADIGERYEPRAAFMTQEEREFIDVWNSEVSTDKIADMFGYANSDSALTRASLLRKKYGVEVVPHRLVRLDDEAYNQEVIRRWNAGMSMFDATGHKIKAKAQSVIRRLREVYGEEAVPYRHPQRSPEYEQEVSLRWKAGASAIEATGITDMHKAARMISNLRIKYGRGHFPLARER